MLGLMNPYIFEKTINPFKKDIINHRKQEQLVIKKLEEILKRFDIIEKHILTKQHQCEVSKS